MEVRTRRRHGNAYGEKYRKEAGDIYRHPAPQHLIDEGLVAEVRRGPGGRFIASGEGAAPSSAG